MANVRKVTQRRRRDGSSKISWRATWIGADGKRRSKNFPRKGDADAHLKLVDHGVSGGSPTMSVLQLAEAHYGWFEGLVRIGKRSPGTLDGYESHIDCHIKADPAFAKLKLCDLTTVKCQEFLDALLTRTGSLDLVDRLRGSLVTWCAFGQRKGWLVANPARACTVEREEGGGDEDAKCEIPAKADLSKLIRAAGEGPAPIRDTAVLRLLMFGGFRISELLGMADDAVDFTAAGANAYVRESLERRHKVLRPPKSKKGRRKVPIGKIGANSVRAWRMARGPARAFMHTNQRREQTRVLGRLFPNPDGGDLWGYDDFTRDCWVPMMRRAGLVEMIPDAKGKNRPVPAFSPHTLRHVAASLWIDQNLKQKKVQELLGHATLQLTMDLYGHLWHDEAADDALAQASERLIG